MLNLTLISLNPAPTIAETEGLMLTTVGQNDLLSENFTAPGDNFEILTESSDDQEVSMQTMGAEELQDFTESWTDGNFFDLDKTGIVLNLHRSMLNARKTNLVTGKLI